MAALNLEFQKAPVLRIWTWSTDVAPPVPCRSYCCARLRAVMIALIGSAPHPRGNGSVYWYRSICCRLDPGLGFRWPLPITLLGEVSVMHCRRDRGARLSSAIRTRARSSHPAIVRVRGLPCRGSSAALISKPRSVFFSCPRENVQLLSVTRCTLVLVSQLVTPNVVLRVP